MAQILKGAPVVAAMNEVTAAMNEKLQARVAALKEKGIVPTLAVVRVGAREDDISYEKGIVTRCGKVGVEVRQFHLAEDVTQEELLDVIRQVDMPARRIAWLHDTLTPKTYLDLEPSIRQLEQPAQESVVFLGKVGVGISRARLEEGTYTEYDRVFLLLDQEDVYQGKEEALPPERCLTVRFRGSHREAEGYYRRLMEYIRRERLEILGPSKEITMIDDGMTSDTEKFVTEIQIPVGPSEGETGFRKKEKENEK